MNTPLEVMKAIVDNGGPLTAWVSEEDEFDEAWVKERVVGIALHRQHAPFLCEVTSWRFCSLTDPNANYKPIPTEWTHGWASWRAVDKTGVLFEYSKSKPMRTDDGWINGGSVRWISKGHDPTNWQDSLEERPRKTRPMTPREAALFLHGQPYAIRFKADTEICWTSDTTLNDDTDVGYWQYADLRDPDFPQWKDFPTVDV